MRKPKKFVRQVTAKQSSSEDSDEMQLFDECNSEWVDAWKGAAERLAPLDVDIILPVEQEKKLVRNEKRR
jgi:hypothetical protein